MRTNLVTEDYHPWLHAYSLCGPRSTARLVYTSEDFDRQLRLHKAAPVVGNRGLRFVDVKPYW